MNSSDTARKFLFVIRNPVDHVEPSPEEMQQAFTRVMTWMNEMRARGHFLGGEPLEDRPARLLRGREKIETDGPFAEAKEIVAGYLLIAARDLDHAVELARTWPACDPRGSIEIRQIGSLAP